MAKEYFEDLIACFVLVLIAGVLILWPDQFKVITETHLRALPDKTAEVVLTLHPGGEILSYSPWALLGWHKVSSIDG